MCGYCTENIALDIVEQQYLELEISLTDFDIALGIHLQEMDDLQAAISLCGNVNDRDDVNIIKEMILCRLITHLFRMGFDAEYQSIVEMDSVRSIIKEKCTPINTFKNDLSDFFGNDHKGVLPLYDQKTFTVRRQWESFIASAPDFMNSYKQALNHYHKWWYIGKNLTVGGNTRESGNGVIVDCLFARDENECKKFETIFRTLVFSIMLISEQPDPQETVEKIIRGNPRYVPTFTGLDLWLQRIAVSHYYKKHKQEFNGNLNIRLPLLWYFAFANRMGGEERIKLATQIEANAKKHQKLTDKDLYPEDELLECLEGLRGFCELSEERRRFLKKKSYAFEKYIREVEIDD